ncbi:hypothetical protein BDV93DRAFT_502248 [Ceratobasidium sp. AG-I]|nr:hypothetical protein BDV93DRAFT_502248 [Ceratobasidium sp. AG-I]
MSSSALRRLAQGAKNIKRQAIVSRTRLASTSSNHTQSKPDWTPAQKIQRTLYENQPISLPRLPWNLSKARQALASRARDGNIVAAIDIWNRLVDGGVKPDAVMYLLLLRIMASARRHTEALKLYKDMVKADVGELTAGLNLVLLASVENPIAEARVLKLFDTYGLVPDVTTYQFRLTGLSIKDNLESAIQVLEEMQSRGITPNRECIRTVVLLASRLNMPKLAMDLMVNVKESVGVMDEEVHMGILMAAAATLNAEVTQDAWDLVSAGESLPTEPLCIEVLHVASRHGLPDLALSVLGKLQGAHVSLLEHHLAPLIGAYSAAGQIKEAFDAIEWFHNHKVPVLPETTSSLASVLSKSTTALDEGYSILASSTRPVDIHAINTTLQAAVNLSDLPRAIGIYKELPDLECTPIAHTYDILLAGCLGASHSTLGERLFSEMTPHSIQPTLQTYTRLILLSLTQDNYELAFERLEEMKGRRMIPPVRVYDSLVRRCVAAGDARAEMALEDMEHCGYRVSVSLRKFVMGEAGGEEGEEDIWEEEGTREWRVGRMDNRREGREKRRSGSRGDVVSGSDRR